MKCDRCKREMGKGHQIVVEGRVARVCAVCKRWYEIHERELSKLKRWKG
jgi:ribosome-binding protein aMBF1 (putative translation factor)